MLLTFSGALCQALDPEVNPEGPRHTGPAVATRWRRRLGAGSCRVSVKSGGVPWGLWSTSELTREESETGGAPFAPCQLCLKPHSQ